MNTQHIQLPVSISFAQVVAIVKQLTPKDRIRLQKVLQESAETDIEHISEEHKNIVRQRIAATEADPARLLNWDDVKGTLKV